MTDTSAKAAGESRTIAAAAIQPSASGAATSAVRGGTPGPVRVRTIVLIRWFAVAGQAITLLVVRYVLGFSVQLAPAFAVVGASVLLNLAVTLFPPQGGRLDDRQATLFLVYDTLQLAMLLFLTGGLENPFSLLMLGPVTISATILSQRSTIALSMLAVLLVSLIAFWHLPLPWNGSPPAASPILVVGEWVALVLSILVIVGNTLTVVAEARRMSDALAATQLALAREQRLSAVGALAAAAAHELGSPLSTIAVVAKELRRDLPADNPLAEDIRLLVSQSDRCRDILARLSRLPENDGGSPLERLPLSAVVELAALPHERDEIDIEYRAAPMPGAEPTAEPVVRRSPELVNGLANLLQNALQFAKNRIEVATTWTDSEVIITILDDGPGFAGGVLQNLGEPYLSSRDQREPHMGLGVFIALNLLGRTGATVEFDNRTEGGARVDIHWMRPRLEAD